MHHRSSKRERSPDAVEDNSSNKKQKPDPFKDMVDNTIDNANQTHSRVKKKTTPEPTPKNHSKKPSQKSNTSTANSVGISEVSDGDVADEPDNPQTPIKTTGSRPSQTTPLSIISGTGSIPHVDSPDKSTTLLFEAESGAKMDVRLGHGDYVVSIQKRSIISSLTYENRKEDANQLPQNPGMPFLSSEMLSKMIEKAGEQMFAKYLECLREHHQLGKSSVPGQN